MVRLACVNTPQLPLQLLFREHPEWRDSPTAVVSEDKPLGRVISINRKAQELGIEPGMRFAAALTLCSVLQAAVVPEKVLEAGIAGILTILDAFTPEVEPCTFEAGMFWINASGTEMLYGSVNAWAERLVRAFHDRSFFAAVTIGFSRFGTYACSKRRPQVKIFADPDVEERSAFESPIAILPFPPLVHERMEHLGIRTVGSFARLSRGSIGKRFGKDIAAIHDFVTGAKELPLHPLEAAEPNRLTRALQTPEADLDRLVLRIEELLSTILSELDRAALIHRVIIELRTEEGLDIESIIRPAKPTRVESLLIKLIALRIQNTTIPGAVERVSVEVETVRQGKGQEELFAEYAERDSRSADAAFALIRAELGNESIVHSTLQAEHLPEFQFHLEPLYTMPPSKKGDGPASGSKRQILVRRILTNPSYTQRSFPRASDSPSQHRSSQAGDRRQSQDVNRGPFVVTGAWWQAQVDREYYFIPTRLERFLWVYFDRLSDRWKVQGWID